MDHRLDETRASLPSDGAHHAEVQIGQASIGESKKIARVWVSVEKAMFEKLLQTAVHSNSDHLIRVSADRLDRF